MSAVDEFAADSPDVGAEASSLFSHLAGVRSRFEAASLRKAKAPTAPRSPGIARRKVKSSP